MSLDPLSAVVSSLKREQVIPDVLPESFTPSILFSIVYPSGREVLLGNEFPLEETRDEPTINFAPMTVPWEQNEDAGEVGYTLVMLDPDVPSRAEPEFKSFRHWVITGLKSPADAASATADSAALQSHPATCSYRPPRPRPGLGLHRYTFILFQEPSPDFKIPEGAIEYGEEVEERRRWDVNEFAKKYNLKAVGANFTLIRSPPAETEQ